MRRTKVFNHRLLLAASAGAAAILGGQAAFAADNSSTTAVEEVVVTAEKRAVNIQDVPASVSAVKGDKLTDLGLSSLTDYAQYVPGLVITNGGTPGQASVTLRGVAAVGPGSVVGYYVDDTPLGSSGNYARATAFALDLMPYDVERFEVLRGPQGTLYGAGSMGGLIKYVLKQADTNQFSGQVGGELNYTDHSAGAGGAARAAINIPLITDKLAIRGSIYDREYQGYVDNVRLGEGDTNDGHQRGGRVAVTFKPVDNLRINLNAMFNREHFNDTASVRLGNVTTHMDDGVVVYSGKPIYGPFGHSFGYDQPFTKNIDYYSGTLNWDLGGVTVTSATSWSKTNTHQVQDATDAYGVYSTLVGLAPGVAKFDLQLELKKFTEEFRVASPTGGKLEWLAGAYYTNETSANHQLANVYDANYQPIPNPIFSPFFALAELPTKYKEYAFFGDVTLNLTSKFDITGGLRYAHNDQDYHQITDGFILGGFIDHPGGSSESVTTWQVNARYHFTDQVMAYGRIATGYRPGGPNVALPGVPPVVNSDTLTSYEAGIKSTFWGGRALLNLTAFDIEWKDIQLSVFNLSCGCSYLSNGGGAYSRGFELEGSLVPTDGLRIGYNLAYTKGALTSLAPGAPPYYLGYQLPGVPRWAGAVTADYEWPAFNNGWRPSVGGSLRYVGEEWVFAPDSPTGIGYIPNTKNPSYVTADLRAGLSNDRYQVNLFVRNLTNKLVYTSQSAVQDPFSGATYALDSVPLEPRVIGISVDAKF